MDGAAPTDAPKPASPRGLGFNRGYETGAFCGIANAESWRQAVRGLFRSLSMRGRYASDNMLVWGRSLSFLDDAPFMAAVDSRAQTEGERGILWRTHTLAWAARQALALEGDLVECGVYRGTTARILADLVAPRIGARRFWLYDAFEWREGDAHDRMEAHGPALETQVRARFEDAPFVRIVKGYVPGAFAEGAPERVAFLHIDLNNAEGEAAALAYFWERLVPGAAVVFDDFGWCGYWRQRLVHETFAAERGTRILELPTGQGLLIKQAG